MLMHRKDEYNSEYRRPCDDQFTLHARVNLHSASLIGSRTRESRFASCVRLVSEHSNGSIHTNLT